jgi:hypothetical protein
VFVSNFFFFFSVFLKSFSSSFSFLIETILLAGGSEILTVTPTLPNRQISVLIRPTRNVPVTLRVQVSFSSLLLSHPHSLLLPSSQTHVGVRGFNTNLFVFDKMLNVPRFASFAQLNESSPVTTPVSHVSFRINEDMTRFISWMQASFILFNPPKVSLLSPPPLPSSLLSSGCSR